MNKSNVIVEFDLYGDNFDPEDITEQLKIQPSETYRKGELIRNGKITRKETSWTISSARETSFDINEQLGKVVLLFETKEAKLIELIEKYQLSAAFTIIVYIENEDVPAMYLRKEFIQFASRIEARIGFDVYVC